MRTALRFTLMRLLFLSILPVLVIQQQPLPNFIRAPDRTVRGDTDCQETLNLLTEDENWFDKLVDPVLTTQAQVTERLYFYIAVNHCLGDDIESLSSELRLLHLLTEYFMIFAGGYFTPPEETNLYLVSLGNSNDPAVRQIRDEAGIVSPPGYIYVRFYTSREAMPDIVRKAFANNQVAGVTILLRYIAVLAEKKESWPQQALQSQTLPETISHELIHAYVNSLVGFENLDAFPKWFDEGVAIYFSGSGKNHTVITPDFTVSTTSPVEYQQYKNHFIFLEKEVGRKHFLNLIKRSVTEIDSSVLYQELGITDDQDLFEHVRAWKEKRDRIQIGIGIAAALLIGWGILRLMPEVRCKNCGYGGKKREFAYGYCPSCHRRYDKIVVW